MQSGIISRIYGSYYDLLALPHLEQEFRGRLRGRLRLEKSRSKHKKERHLLIIGDEVLFSPTGPAQNSKQGGATGQQWEEVVIEQRKERQNCIERGQSHEIQVLGANLNRAILLASLCDPAPKFDFIDRFLCSAYAGNVKPIVVFSKIDLLSRRERRSFMPMIKLYRQLGYKIYLQNLLNRWRLRLFRRSFRGEVILLVGQSGTGKSTLINGIFAKERQKTAIVSLASRQGRHTTTNSRLLLYKPERSLWIDTPGIKDWGLQHLDHKTILASFPEIRASMQQCRFSDCKHEAGSAGCEVAPLLERSRYPEANGKSRRSHLHPSRLRSLNNILASLQASTG